ncbi:MAG: FMN-binding negative transcriptional regulator [Flavobacteriales bacterium]|jgi:transcriptional regulator|uniref:FMN-binding negative transcriptional regulator n=1 Tax=Candidatus Ulvibacter alkanivorans TaxID=2267620 RepID=UPI000DF1E938|nr:FMN-binding negative transcriptional regulator [Candidatus Ulvibacter alkanivorans]MCH2490594.1 FMN-binding negative transcriptional regulator [Flavobacteriales bacterium]
MYPPPHHQTDDRQKIIAVIEHYPLGMLVTARQNRPYTTHLPFIYNKETGKLVAHIDKNNPQLESLTNNSEVTVIFKGPDCYISPSIYTTEQLPTWNYIIVHVTGTVTLIDDVTVAKESMLAMTSFLEGPDPAYELKHDNPSMDRLVHYIQAFTITPTHWEGKFKLSQDKNPTDYERAKEALIRKSGASATGFINTIYDL